MSWCGLREYQWAGQYVRQRENDICAGEEKGHLCEQAKKMSSRHYLARLQERQKQVAGMSVFPPWQSNPEGPLIG
jgi:hypothetical protein